jgi:hypothetical protein
MEDEEDRKENRKKSKEGRKTERNESYPLLRHTLL